MYCGEHSLVNRGEDGIRAVSLRCRAWTCPDCRKRRKRQLIALALSGEPTMFLTLTVDPKTGTSKKDRARTLARALPVIIRRAKAKYGYKDIQYLCVFEACESGEPHLHILARCPWIGKRWLSDQLRKLTGASVVDVQRVEDKKKLAWYIAKYIGKDPHRFETCKRYWSTQGWELTKFEPQKPPGRWHSNWEIRRVSLWELAEEWRAEGREVEETGSTILARCRGPTPSELEAYDNIMELRSLGLPW